MRPGCPVSVGLNAVMSEDTDPLYRFYALSYSETVTPLPSKFVLLAGNEWAKVAQRLILESLDTVTIENTRVRPHSRCCSQ
jgi:hypothetical protein